MEIRGTVKLRPTLRSKLGTVVLLILVVFGAFFIRNAGPEMMFGSLRMIYYFVLVGLAVLLVGALCYHLLANNYTLTERQAEEAVGLFSKTANSVELAHVRHVSLRQSFLGRMMNYGDVGLSSSGGDDVEVQLRGISTQTYTQPAEKGSTERRARIASPNT